MLKDFLIPVEKEFQTYFKELTKRSLGGQVLFFESELPEVKNGVALIHVPEYRGAKILEKSSDALLLRRALYQLTELDGNMKLIDMGDLKLGAKLEDTYAALKCVCEELIEQGIFPLVLGGAHDLTIAQTKSIKPENGKGLNLLIVDQKINFFDTQSEELNDENFLMELLSSNEIKLFDFNHLGHQMHFTSGEALHTLDKLNFEAYRLSELQDDLKEVEPITRDADLLSIDLSAIRYPDAKGVLDPSPNGFFGHQMCQIMRYSGFSHRMKSLGIFGVDFDADEKGQTAQLLAQMVWYFLEARSRSKDEFPDYSKKNFMRYSVNVDGTEGEMVFLKSRFSEKWWMEIPDLIHDGDQASKYLIPCSYVDYQLASQNEIPERWMKAVQKFN